MIDVVPLRAFKDNYIWTLRAGPFAAVVDPGDAAPVLDYLSAEDATLVAILATHHHADHVGGIPELRRAFDVPVYDPRAEPIATVTRPVAGGDRVGIPEIGITFEVLDIPRHTRAHVAYYGAKALFCGDTLFACGCGRLFEGTPEQMHMSLSQLAALPDDTLVYCGHECTLANIEFAKAAELGNDALAARAPIPRRGWRASPPSPPPSDGRRRPTLCSARSNRRSSIPRTSPWAHGRRVRSRSSPRCATGKTTSNAMIVIRSCLLRHRDPTSFAGRHG